METLPPYFKEYMEQKFNELHQKIDTVFDKHDTEIEEIRKDVSWLKQKIWMALGALAVISVVGGVFATYFKELNKNQINESLQNLLSKYNIIVDYEK